MRILHLIDVCWWNACAYYAIELARGLRAAGDEVVVAGSRAAPPITRARELGLETWESAGFGERQPLLQLAFFPRFVGELEQRGFDVIDAHRAPGQLWAALASSLRGGPPVVRTRGDIRPPRRHPFGRWLHGRLTAASVTPSRFMARSLIHGLGLEADRVHVVPAGIDATARIDAEERRRAAADCRADLGVPENAPLLAIVARLSPIKGHTVLLEALARVRGEPAPHLCIVGDEEEVRARDLQCRAAELGLAGRVHVLGRLSDPRALLAGIDLLVITSLGSEAICRVLLEAMAAGLPTVASDVGVIGEVLVPERTGLLVPPGDVAALATTLDGLLYPWPAARERLRCLGEAARDRIDTEYRLALWVERARGVYTEVIERHRRHRPHEDAMPVMPGGTVTGVRETPSRASHEQR